MIHAKKAHEPPWDELARIQAEVADDKPRTRARRQALDDAYSVVLDELGEHTAASLRQRFSNLVSNRRRKFRERRAIEKFLVRGDTEADDALDPVEILSRREVAAQVLTEVGPGERALLWAVAEGRSYEDLAAEAREPAGTIKARVSRLRTRLRGRFPQLALAA